MRLLFAIFIALSLLWLPAQAGQTGANFNVGIRVLGKHPKKRHRTSAVAIQKHYTWNAAHVTLIRARYQRIAKEKTSKNLYWFTARKRGATFRIAVSRNKGRIVQVARR